jgi:flagellar hook-basal body complex protein FliE
MNLIPSIQAGISGVGGIGGLEASKSASGAASGAADGTFAGMLEGLQSFEQQGGSAMTDLAVGGEMDLHDVVLAAEMESIAFNLAVEIRNRLVDAYSEIFRMQI